MAIAGDFSLPATVDPETLAADDRWWALYERAFPACEREPRETILASLNRHVGFALRTRARQGTVGIASAHVLRDPAVVFLVYLAVAEQYRGQGLGEALFEATRREGARRLGGTTSEVVWEVDIPGLAATREVAAVRTRRILFFQRLGGLVLEYNYRQPPVNGPEPVPMYLMFRPVPGAPAPLASWTARLVRAVYLEKYAAINGIPVEQLWPLLPNVR